LISSALKGDRIPPTPLNKNLRDVSKGAKEPLKRKFVFQ
jgi:hypothetical protein